MLSAFIGFSPFALSEKQLSAIWKFGRRSSDEADEPLSKSNIIERDLSQKKFGRRRSSIKRSPGRSLSHAANVKLDMASISFKQDSTPKPMMQTCHRFYGKLSEKTKLWSNSQTLGKTTNRERSRSSSDDELIPSWLGKTWCKEAENITSDVKDNRSLKSLTEPCKKFYGKLSDSSKTLCRTIPAKDLPVKRKRLVEPQDVSMPEDSDDDVPLFNDSSLRVKGICKVYGKSYSASRYLFSDDDVLVGSGKKYNEKTPKRTPTSCRPSPNSPRCLSSQKLDDKSEEKSFTDSHLQRKTKHLSTSRLAKRLFSDDEETASCFSEDHPVQTPGSDETRHCDTLPSWKPPVGFSNLGNTCFMNVVLQALFSLKTFSGDLLSSFKSHEEILEELSLLRCLSELALCQRDSNSSHSLITSKLKKVLSSVSKKTNRYDDQNEHDAHEFLTEVIDIIKDEAILYNNKVNCDEKSELIKQSDQTNPCVDNFEFQLQTRLQCTACHKLRRINQMQNGLTVSIPRLKLPPVEGEEPCIQDALGSYFRKETVELLCEDCGCSQASSTQLFTSLPRILIVAVRRYDTGGASVKVDAELRINNQISLLPYIETSTCSGLPAKQSFLTEKRETNNNYTLSHMASERFPNIQVNDQTPSENRDWEKNISSPLRLARKRHALKAIDTNASDVEEVTSAGEVRETDTKSGIDSGCSYKLVGIISHIGSTTSFGHYVNDVYNADKDSWITYSDTAVSVSTEENIISLRRSSGYVFFYMNRDVMATCANEDRLKSP